MEIKMKIKKIALMAIVGLISVLGISCGRTMNSKQVSADSKEVKNEKKAEYKKITSDEAKNIMSTQKAIVVDVSRSGRRSREATLRLIEKGYTNVIDFGGIQDWNGEVVK